MSAKIEEDKPDRSNITLGLALSPKVTHSMGHYLMAVRDQLGDYGYARVTDIASRLDISQSSSSVALASLRDKGYLTEDKNHFFQLTEKGQELARQISGNHFLLETFFQKILLVSEEAAMVDSCQIEHLLSKETSQKLLCFLNYFMNNENELKALVKKTKHYRRDCSQRDSCGLCRGEVQCPFKDD